MRMKKEKAQFDLSVYVETTGGIARHEATDPYKNTPLLDCELLNALTVLFMSFFGLFGQKLIGLAVSVIRRAKLGLQR